MNTIEILSALRVAGVGLRKAQSALNQAASDLEWRIEQIKDVHVGLMLDGSMSTAIKALGLDKF